MADPLTSVAAKVAAPVAGRVSGGLWRRWRPDTSAAALTTRADGLADVVRRTETERLEQFGCGADYWRSCPIAVGKFRPHWPVSQRHKSGRR